AVPQGWRRLLDEPRPEDGEGREAELAVDQEVDDEESDEGDGAAGGAERALDGAREPDTHRARPKDRARARESDERQAFEHEQADGDRAHDDGLGRRVLEPVPARG